MSTPYGPLPWSYVVIGRNDVGGNVCVVLDAAGHAIAEYLTEEDAMYIVKCVNANSELVAAGGRCISALAANGAPNCEAVKEMRAALSKVTGVRS